MIGSRSDSSSWPALACLMAVLMMMMVMNLVATSEASIYRPDYVSQQEDHRIFQEEVPGTFQSSSLQSTELQDSSRQASTLGKEDIRQELLRQLLVLKEAEESLLHKIRKLEAERRAVTNRKRSHYNSQCMFNVVACYRK